MQPKNGKAHPKQKKNTWNGFIRDAAKGEPTEEELDAAGREKASGAKGEKRWRQKLNKLRKKMIDGEQLSTEEIEGVLLWKALGWVRAAQTETHDKGLKLLETIYETRSKAKLAPGNNPAKKKPAGLAAKYGTDLNGDRPSTAPVPESQETPRTWQGPE